MKTFKALLTEIVGERPTRVEVGPHGVGSNITTSYGSMPTSSIKTSDTIGNEPFKNDRYFGRAKLKHKMGRLATAARRGKLTTPVISISHPADSSKHVVLDGNHRLQAHRIGGSSALNSHVMSHDEVHLVSGDTTHSLSSFREPNGSYDMNRPHRRLGGLSLNHYFVKPDGSHSFKQD